MLSELNKLFKLIWVGLLLYAWVGANLQWFHISSVRGQCAGCERTAWHIGNHTA